MSGTEESGAAAEIAAIEASIRDDRNFASSALSTQARAIALSVLALVWLLLGGTQQALTSRYADYSENLIYIAMVAVAALLADFLHYAFSLRESDKALKETIRARTPSEAGYDEDSSLRRIHTFFFFIKVGATVVASIWILIILGLGVAESKSRIPAQRPEHTAKSTESIALGDAATWAGALATFAAVVLALNGSRKAERDNQERDHALRHQLAVPFDNEMYLLAGQLRYASEAMNANANDGDWNAVLKHLHEMPRVGLVLMERFALEFRAFPLKTANQLFLVLSRWGEIKHSPAPEFSDDDQMGVAVLFVTQTIDQLLEEIGKARRLVREYAPPELDLTPLD